MVMKKMIAKIGLVCFFCSPVFADGYQSRNNVQQQNFGQTSYSNVSQLSVQHSLIAECFGVVTIKDINELKKLFSLLYKGITIVVL